jgi:predicted DNA-binding transcriptional regulator AlpA
MAPKTNGAVLMKLSNLNNPIATGDILGVSLPTLARWRGQGIGPAFIKIGHKVGYLDTDIEAWLESQRRTFTRQGGAA